MIPSRTAEESSDPVGLNVRADGYLFLSQLLLTGVRASDLEQLRLIPDLSRHLPDISSETSELGLGDLPTLLDTLAVEHHRVFGCEVPPYASVFLDPGGMLGGQTTRWVDEERQSARLAPPMAETADHLGRELELLATLSRAGTPEGMDPSSLAVRRFIEDHLLWWLPSLIVTVDPLGSSFWSELLRLVLELVMDHRAMLARVHGSGRQPTQPPTLSVDDTGLGTSDEARAPFESSVPGMTEPIRCGALITPHELRAIGRSNRLPTGFGGRARLLETLLDSASAYDTPVTRVLVRLLDDRRDALVRLAEEFGVPAVYTEPWLRRLEVTTARLRVAGNG